MKLNPKDQFNASESNVREALMRYGLELTSFEPAKTGIENTTLLVKTGRGGFVLRIFRQNKKTDALIDEEIRFTNFLGQNKLPVPAIISNVEEQYLTHLKLDSLQWQMILMEQMTGVHAEHYLMPLIESMAHIQAKMHTLSESYKYNDESFPMLRELRETVIIKQIVKEGIDERLLAFLSRAENYVLQLSHKLPSGICHLDYSKGNVLVDDSSNVSAILDFDDMEAAPYAICLGFALYHLILGGASKDERQEYLRQY